MYKQSSICILSLPARTCVRYKSEPFLYINHKHYTINIDSKVQRKTETMSCMMNMNTSHQDWCCSPTPPPPAKLFLRCLCTSSNCIKLAICINRDNCHEAGKITNPAHFPAWVCVSVTWPSTACDRLCSRKQATW